MSMITPETYQKFHTRWEKEFNEFSKEQKEKGIKEFNFGVLQLEKVLTQSHFLMKNAASIDKRAIQRAEGAEPFDKDFYSELEKTKNNILYYKRFLDESDFSNISIRDKLTRRTISFTLDDLSVMEILNRKEFDRYIFARMFYLSTKFTKLNNDGFLLMVPSVQRGWATCVDPVLSYEQMILKNCQAALDYAFALVDFLQGFDLIPVQPD